MSNKRNKNQRAKKVRLKKVKPARNSVNSLDDAVGLHRAGNLKQAEICYKNILATDQNNVSALNYYGMFLFQHGDKKQGIELVRRSVELDPDYSDAINNLANMLMLQGHLKDAEKMYNKCVSINPAAADAYVNLGVLARSQKKYDVAEDYYRQAIDISPDLLLAYVNLGHLLEARGRTEEALEIYDLASDLRGYGDADHFYRIANIYNRLGRMDECVSVYKQWLRMDPNNATAKHMLAAITAEDTPEKPDQDYVKTLFDRFSNSFDEVLDNLDYKAPELVGEMVVENYPNEKNTLDILDAGCGTGLCARYLVDLSKRLIGVDLSPGMLDKAKLLDQYHQLIAADLIEYLAGISEEFDLIVSADTFCYFGSLDQLIQQCSSALVSDGRLIFTVEMSDAPTDTGYILNPHGRYSHNLGYLENTITASHLVVNEIKEVILRRERGEAVTGFLVLCRKQVAQ